MDNLPVYIAWYLVFVVSTVLHEASHAFVALKLGDLTAYHAGQVTLNPEPHMRREPFGMLIVPIISLMVSGWALGWASAPYDPVWEYRYPKRSALMSLAGPVANLLLVLFAALLIHLGIYWGVLSQPESIGFTTVVSSGSGVAAVGKVWHMLAIILSILFSLNLILFLFNLIPLPPLDGSGILQLFISPRLARSYQQMISQRGVALVGIIVAWNIFPHVIDPVFTMALNLLYPGSGYQ